MSRCFLIALGLVGMLTGRSGAEPAGLIAAFETEFSREGRAYRFVGMNIRGLVHYGGGDGALPYTNVGHIEENLSGAANMGCRVIRVFAANRNISHQEAVDRLGHALDKADQYGLKLIVALTDFYPTPFHPQGDDGYYTVNPWGWTVLNHDWFEQGYQDNYLPYVTLAVDTYKDHPAVFSWQLGNEIADQVSADTHDAFVHAVAGHIKSLDPHHMVSTGMLSLAHIPGYTVQWGIALYSDPNVDFITAHRYNDQAHPIDFAVRDAVGKPIVISEVGCDRNHEAVVGGDRVGFMSGRVDHFVGSLGARGFMNWGYQAQAYDIGDGDNVYGIDRYAHSDYDAMVSMYARHAAALNAYDEPLVAEDGPRGRKLSMGATVWQTDSDISEEFSGDKALDGLLSTKWCSTNQSSVHWLALDLGADHLVTGYRTYLASTGGECGLMNWRHFMIEVGPSLSGPWTTAFEVSNGGQSGVVTSAYEVAVMGRYVRLRVDDCGVDNYARLYEFEVIGDPKPRGDFDEDGDVDLADAAWFQVCFRGGGASQPGTVAGFDCERVNLHHAPGDPAVGDVDRDDYEVFSGCLAGPGGSCPLSCY